MLVFSSFCFHLCGGRFVQLPLLTVINETNFTQPFKIGVPSKLSFFFFFFPELLHVLERAILWHRTYPIVSV